MKDSKKYQLDLNSINDQKIKKIINSMRSSYLFLFNIHGYKIFKSSIDKDFLKQLQEVSKNIKTQQTPELLINRKLIKYKSGKAEEKNKELSREDWIKQFEIPQDQSFDISDFEQDLADESKESSSETDSAFSTKEHNIQSKKQLVFSEFDDNLFQEDYIQSFTPQIFTREIEYKKIEVRYFNDQEGYLAEEIAFSYTKKYMSEEFLLKLDKDKSDTTAVNIGTGDGKTYTSYQLIKYYAQKGFVIIIASPYTVITNRDYHQLSSEFSENIKIVNYNDLKTGNLNEFVRADIHSITINSLLGNPGGDPDDPALNQSEIKKKYLDELANYCQSNNKKVVIFFDELHASINNFKPKFRVNLYRWMGIVHKIFTFSATYTESSYIVLEYLSALTDKRVTIFNAARKKFPLQANLHLNLTKNRYTSKNISHLYFIKRLVADALSKNERVNILVATQSLTLALTDPNSPEPLAQYLCSLNPNILLGNNNAAKANGFDPEKINIGTTFSTGISIKDPNNTFIIVTPVFIGPESQKLASIFMDGAPAVIQALARVRNGGNIHIFMYPPTHLIRGTYTRSLPPFLDDLKKARYISLDQQTEIVEQSFKAYNSHISSLAQKGHIEKELLYYLNRESYILSKSQYELSSNYEIFGKKVVPYIIWAACNDQITGCTLKSINLIDEPTVKVKIEKDTITSDLKNLLNLEITEEIKKLTDQEALKYMYKDLIVSNDSNPFMELVKNEIYFNGKLIKHEHLAYHPGISKAMINILFQFRYGYELEYDLSMYVLGNITNSKKFKIANKGDKRNNLKAAYTIMKEVRTKLARSVQKDSSPTIDIIDDELEKSICIAVQELKTNDFYIHHKIFSFLQTYQFTILKDGSINFFNSNKSSRRQILLKAVLKVFFEINTGRKRINGEIVREKIVVKEKSIPDKSLNLIF